MCLVLRVCCLLPSQWLIGCPSPTTGDAQHLQQDDAETTRRSHPENNPSPSRLPLPLSCTRFVVHVIPPSPSISPLKNHSSYSSSPSLHPPPIVDSANSHSHSSSSSDFLPHSHSHSHCCCCRSHCCMCTTPSCGPPARHTRTLRRRTRHQR